MAKNKINKRSKDINNNHKKKNAETLVEIEPEFFMKSCSVMLTRLKSSQITKKTNKNSKDKIKTLKKDQSTAIHETVSIFIKLNRVKEEVNSECVAKIWNNSFQYYPKL